MQRYEIVNGIVKIEGETNKAVMDEEGDKCVEGIESWLTHVKFLKLYQCINLEMGWHNLKCRKRSAWLLANCDENEWNCGWGGTWIVVPYLMSSICWFENVCYDLIFADIDFRAGWSGSQVS